MVPKTGLEIPQKVHNDTGSSESKRFRVFCIVLWSTHHRWFLGYLSYPKAFDVDRLWHPVRDFGSDSEVLAYHA